MAGYADINPFAFRIRNRDVSFDPSTPPSSGGFEIAGNPFEEDPFEYGITEDLFRLRAPQVTSANIESVAKPSAGRLSMDELRAMYQPQTRATNRLNTLLDEYPEREDPGFMRKLTASLVGISQSRRQGANPLASMEGIMYAPHMRDVADWKEQTGPAHQAAQIENTYNVNERTLLNNMMQYQSAAEKNETQAQYNRDRIEVQNLLAQVQRAKNVTFDTSGDFLIIKDANNQTATQTNIKVKDLTTSERIGIEQTNKMAQIGAEVQGRKDVATIQGATARDVEDRRGRVAQAVEAMRGNTARSIEEMRSYTDQYVALLDANVDTEVERMRSDTDRAVAGLKSNDPATQMKAKERLEDISFRLQSTLRQNPQYQDFIHQNSETGLWEVDTRPPKRTWSESLGGVEGERKYQARVEQWKGLVDTYYGQGIPGQIPMPGVAPRSAPAPYTPQFTPQRPPQMGGPSGQMMPQQGGQIQQPGQVSPGIPQYRPPAQPTVPPPSPTEGNFGTISGVQFGGPAPTAGSAPPPSMGQGQPAPNGPQAASQLSLGQQISMIPPAVLQQKLAELSPMFPDFIMQRGNSFELLPPPTTGIGTQLKGMISGSTQMNANQRMKEYNMLLERLGLPPQTLPYPRQDQVIQPPPSTDVGIGPFTFPWYGARATPQQQMAPQQQPQGQIPPDLVNRARQFLQQAGLPETDANIMHAINTRRVQ